MPPRKGPAPRAAPRRDHEPVSTFQFYAGSFIVFLSAGLSYALARGKDADDALLVAGGMWMMNAIICLVASWVTNDHSWCAAQRACRPSD
jgi:hypothetical protein